MLLGDFDRYIVECEMELARTPKDAPHMPMVDCLDAIKRAFDKGEATYLISNGKSTVRIIDIKTYDDKGYTILLFQYANSDASDPHFANKKTGISRKADRDEDEAPAVTCHIAIRHVAKKPKVFPDLYKVVVEEVPGLTKSLMASTLTNFINNEANFRFDRFDEKKPREIKCRPIVSINPYASNTLKDSLSTGYLTGLTAVRYKGNKPLDDDEEIVAVQETMVLSFPRSTGKKALRLVKKASDIVRQMDYSELKITRKDKNKRLVSDDIDVSYEKSIEDIADTVFAEKIKVILSNVIIPCQEEIHDQLAGKMEQILLK